jgi:hypothetical protein
MTSKFIATDGKIVAEFDYCVLEFSYRDLVSIAKQAPLNHIP